MKTEKKVFAFKLADKSNEKIEDKAGKSKWKAREGLSVAGCTNFFNGNDEYRFTKSSALDSGVYC